MGRAPGLLSGSLSPFGILQGKAGVKLWEMTLGETRIRDASGTRRPEPSWAGFPVLMFHLCRLPLHGHSSRFCPVFGSSRPSGGQCRRVLWTDRVHDGGAFPRSRPFLFPLKNSRASYLLSKKSHCLGCNKLLMSQALSGADWRRTLMQVTCRIISSVGFAGVFCPPHFADEPSLRRSK